MRQEMINLNSLMDTIMFIFPIVGSICFVSLSSLKIKELHAGKVHLDWWRYILVKLVFLNDIRVNVIRGYMFESQLPREIFNVKYEEGLYCIHWFTLLAQGVFVWGGV